METADVLLIEDDPELREALVDTIMLADYTCHATDSAEAALNILKQKSCGLVVCDVNLHEGKMDGHSLLQMVHRQHPDVPVLLMTAYGSIHLAVQAMRDGAIDYLMKPFAKEILVSKIKKFIQHMPANKYNVVAEDMKSKQLLVMAHKVARSDATVLLTGPSGAGKEVLARYIHDNSLRAAAPFIAINCAAIPDNMLEATLFGYEKGAFTGAYQASSGKFEQAQHGTLLLDEISEMSLALQAKLLRVLQEKEVERVGGKKVISLDVRVIATSNCDLPESVRKGSFREDLYYRINVFPLALTPLRERRNDIIPLAENLLQRHGVGFGRCVAQLTDEAKQILQHYSWPGNVREMNNVLQRALILQTSDELGAEDFEFLKESADFKVNITNELSKINEADDLHAGLKHHEFQLILDSMQENSGNRQMVAKTLGISPRTLRYKLAQMRTEGFNI